MEGGVTVPPAQRSREARPPPPHATLRPAAPGAGGELPAAAAAAPPVSSYEPGTVSSRDSAAQVLRSLARSDRLQLEVT